MEWWSSLRSAIVLGGRHTHRLNNYINSFQVRGRDSSVGRALDWRSKGPWFDPGSRHFFFFFFLEQWHTLWHVYSVMIGWEIRTYIFYLLSVVIKFYLNWQVNAPIWTLPTREHDGLTTNGVAFMRPTGSFESGVHPGEWREVTVMGNVCKLRPQRSSRTPGEIVSLLVVFQSLSSLHCPASLFKKHSRSIWNYVRIGSELWYGQKVHTYSHGIRIQIYGRRFQVRGRIGNPPWSP